MYTKFLTNRTYKRIFLRILGIVMIAGLPLALASCREQASSTPPILREGEALHGMTITTGSEHAVPLEAFCKLDIIDDDVTEIIDCQIPELPRLAIGHMIGVTGWTQEKDASKADWEVYLDGYLLDLDTFQEQTYVYPVLLSSPSAIREVFKQMYTWDIVLIDPSLGLHTLRTTVEADSIVYNRIVNFMIGSTPGTLYLVDRPPVRHRYGFGLK